MLTVENLTKNFDALVAVDGVSFTLDATPIVGLIGPNGSGKTTLFHCLSGFYRPDRGRVDFDGHRLDGQPPYRIARTGIARTFQMSRVLPFLSVRDNLLAVAPAQDGERLLPVFFTPGRVRRREAALRGQAGEILQRLKLDHLADQPAGRLSYGQQKLLEIGRVLISAPRLILLDEPTAGVNPTLIRHIVQTIRDLAGDGIQFFIVEHNMPMIAELCDRVLVMDAGRMIFDGTPAAAQRDTAVVEAYLGRAPDAA